MNGPLSDVLQLAIASELQPVVVVELGRTTVAREVVAYMAQTLGKEASETEDSIELRFYRHPCDYVIRAAKPWAGTEAADSEPT